MCTDALCSAPLPSSERPLDARTIEEEAREALGRVPVEALEELHDGLRDDAVLLQVDALGDLLLHGLDDPARKGRREEGREGEEGSEQARGGQMLCWYCACVSCLWQASKPSRKKI